MKTHPNNYRRILDLVCDRGVLVAAAMGLLLTLSACSTPQHSLKGTSASDSPASPELLVKNIRGVLPKGWEVSWDPQYHWIEVSRLEETLFSGGANFNPNPAPFKGKYKIGLPVRDFMPVEEYQRLVAENHAIRGALEKLEVQMQAIPRSIGGFTPVNPDQQGRVEAYETVKKQLHPLPDYYFKDISVDWLSPELQRLALPTDDQVRAECGAVAKQVQALLNTYPTGTK
jgi:hypothetical protein